MNSVNLFNLIVLILVVIFAILIIVVSLNFEKSNAKELENGKFELKFGYNAYVKFPLYFLGLLIFIPPAINDDSQMALVCIFLSCIIILNIIATILEIKNHRVFFDNKSISKKNLFGKKTTIKLENISKVKFSSFGYGDDLLILDQNGNKIKVDRALQGFNTLVDFLIEKEYLKNEKK